jgi:hypothetical protein
VLRQSIYTREGQLNLTTSQAAARCVRFFLFNRRQHECRRRRRKKQRHSIAGRLKQPPLSLSTLTLYGWGKAENAWSPGQGHNGTNHHHKNSTFSQIGAFATPQSIILSRCIVLFFFLVRSLPCGRTFWSIYMIDQKPATVQGQSIYNARLALIMFYNAF